MPETRIAPETLIDLDRYPLFDRDARSRVVAAARQRLTGIGSAVLPGFLRPEAVEMLVAEATAILPAAHRRDRMLTAYPWQGEPGLPADHPMHRTSPYRMQVAATDQMEPGGATLALYEWDALTELVREMLGLPALYLVKDPMMRCNFTYLRDGDEHGWHFDGNDFVVSLLLQSAEAGGAFEFAAGIRDDGDENFDGVARVMDGASGLTRLVKAEPGTLALFHGRRALHRVTQVHGARPRIILLLSYDERQETVWGADAQRRVFGRAAGELPIP